MESGHVDPLTVHKGQMTEMLKALSGSREDMLRYANKHALYIFDYLNEDACRSAIREHHLNLLTEGEMDRVQHINAILAADYIHSKVSAITGSWVHVHLEWMDDAVEVAELVGKQFDHPIFITMDEV